MRQKTSKVPTSHYPQMYTNAITEYSLANVELCMLTIRTHYYTVANELNSGSQKETVILTIVLLLTIYS